MHKYVSEVLHYIEYKVILGVLTAIFTDSFFKVMFLFMLIEVLDILTRWISQSKKCYMALYPQSKAGIWKYISFMWQARKWRFIRSEAMRTGADKILLYLIIFLVATMVDAAITASNGVKCCTVVCVTVCGCTELLSILENLSEITSANVIGMIKDKIKDKVK